MFKLSTLDYRYQTFDENDNQKYFPQKLSYNSNLFTNRKQESLSL